MKSAGLTSLNHDIMASYPLILTPISQNLGLSRHFPKSLGFPREGGSRVGTRIPS